MRARRLSWALVLAGCATAPPPAPQQSREVLLPDARFVISFGAADEAPAAMIASVLTAAEAPLKRWGSFARPVSIRIRASHAELEAAAGRSHYPWLRAWARPDTVDVQSPRTWSLSGASAHQVSELLAHELTHCLMYQLDGDQDVPLWFLEGMASVTSGQDYRPPEEELWRYLKQHPHADLLRDADTLYRDDSRIVYGAAHRAFALLLRRYGDDGIRGILAAMSTGQDFPSAFRTATQRSEADYMQEFDRYIRSEAWRPAWPARAGRQVPDTRPDRKGGARN
jgi:hypothetical protein